MESLRESWSRLRSWIGREAMEIEMDEEMRFHIEQQAEKHVRAGMAPEEARRAARLSFGAMERFKEESGAAPSSWRHGIAIGSYPAIPRITPRAGRHGLDAGHLGPYTRFVAFRDRLVATIRAARPVLETEGVLVVGSEVPNLLEPGAAATLVVSQDLDVGVPIDRHATVKQRLGELREFEPSAEEPSVWTPRSPDLLELNFVGMDPAQDPAEAYVLEDDTLPLLVFGALSLVSPGIEIEIEGTRVPLPRPSGLLLEKLITDRTGEKGDRDLLVALGLIAIAIPDDLEEFAGGYRRLRPELRHTVRSNLTILSLLGPKEGMPDPRLWRADVAALLGRLSEPDL